MVRGGSSWGWAVCETQTERALGFGVFFKSRDRYFCRLVSFLHAFFLPLSFLQDDFPLATLALVHTIRMISHCLLGATLVLFLNPKDPLINPLPEDRQTDRQTPFCPGLLRNVGTTP